MVGMGDRVCHYVSDPFYKACTFACGRATAMTTTIFSIRKKTDLHNLHCARCRPHVNSGVLCGRGVERYPSNRAAPGSRLKSLFVQLTREAWKLRGTIAPHWFYSFLRADNRAVYRYIQADVPMNSIGPGRLTPGETFRKPFGQQAVDFISAGGYISMPYTSGWSTVA